MRKSFLQAILLLLVSDVLAQGIQDNTRLLYLFGPPQTVNQQLDKLATDKAGCAERDLEIIIADTAKLRDDLYQRYRAKADQFTVVLVGKDGGEKFRSTKPVSTQQLFAIIDQMPMRKQEIKLKPNQ